MADPGPGEAIELGVTYLSVVGETHRFADSIKDAVRRAQRYANEHPIQLRADVDVSHIGAIEIPVTANTARFTRQVRDAVTDAQRYATRHPIQLRATIDVEHIRSVQIPIDPDMDGFARQVREGLAAMEASGLFRFSIPVDLDAAGALAQMAALRRQLERMATPIRQEIDISSNRSHRGGLRNVGPVGGTFLAAGAAAAIAAIGGAAGAALGAVGALGVGIAALGPIAAAAGATVAVGISGVGDAFKALAAAQEASGSDGGAQAKAVAAAQKQVESAIRGVTSAEKDLRSAKKDASAAEEDLTRARKDAQEQLEDYRLTLADAALSEKEAALALKEAQQDVFDAKTPAEREKALLRVERAQLRLLESQERNRDVQQEASEAERKGIEGSDGVVSAKQRVADANERIIEAEQNLVDAQRQVIEAQAAVADAATGSSAAQDKAAAALAKLAPNAQAFVLATRALGPAWTDLRKAVQDTLFEGSAQGITELANTALPTLKAGMVDVAGSANGLTKQFAEFWKAPENLAGIQSIFAGTAKFIDGMGPGLQQATTGFLSFGKAFEPVANKVGAQLGGMLGQIGQAFTDAFESGALTQLFSTFGDILEGLGQGLRPLIAGLIEMGNIVGPTLGPFFAQFGQSIAGLAPSLGKLGATFVNTLTKLLPHVEKFIDALARGLEPVLPVLGDVLASLFNALTPLIEPLSQIAQTIGHALVGAFDALAPAIGPLGEAFASLIAAVAPLLPLFAEVLSGIIQALAPALTTVFNALGPVIQAFADALLPVFRELQPILAQTAQKLGDALAGALTALVPLVPQIVEAFGGLIVALAPLLPQLAEIAVQLLPPMVEMFVECYPALLALIELFTLFAETVLIPIVIPAMAKMTEVQAGFLTGMVDAVRFIKENFGPAVAAIGGWFTDLGGIVSGAWDYIVRAIAGSVKIIGQLLQKIEIPDWVPGVGGKGTSGLGDDLVRWAEAHGARTGGLLRGKGTGTSDSILLAASNGEFIVNAKATRETLPLLEAINDGWVPSPEFLHRMIPGFASGGVVSTSDSISAIQQAMWDVLRTQFPNAILTSATRTRDVGSGYDYHMQAKAIDIAGPNMAGMAAWIAQNYGGSLELIHSPFSHNIKNGKDVGDGYSFYGAGTMAGHADHVHWAMSSAPTATGLEPKGDGDKPAPSLGGGGNNPPPSLGGGTQTPSSPSGNGGNTTTPSTPVGDAVRVFVVNWPGTTATPGTATGTTAGSAATPEQVLVGAGAIPAPSTTATTGPWWTADTPEQAMQQLNERVAAVDVPGRATQALSSFAEANVTDFLGTLGIRSSGGAIQELVKVIQTHMANEIAEQLRRSRTSAASFIGRR